MKLNWKPQATTPGRGCREHQRTFHEDSFSDARIRHLLQIISLLTSPLLFPRIPPILAIANG